MLGFLKERLNRRMNSYCATIQIAFAMKLAKVMIDQIGKDNGNKFAAAITNRVLAQPPSPIHASLPAASVDKLAADFIAQERDNDMYLGIILSLRTMMHVATEAHGSATARAHCRYHHVD